MLKYNNMKKRIEKLIVLKYDIIKIKKSEALIVINKA